MASESAPQWTIAVKGWKEKYPDEFVALQNLGIEISESARDNTTEPFRFQEAKATSKQTVARIKRWLPVLSAVRGIAMTAAAADPHKIAPIVCASVFFAIDVSVPCSLITLMSTSLLLGVALYMPIGRCCACEVLQGLSRLLRISEAPLLSIYLRIDRVLGTPLSIAEMEFPRTTPIIFS